MKLIRRTWCLLLCLLLLPLPAWAEGEAEAPAPTVRVLLRRLNLTDRADLRLDGVYTASLGDGPVMAFPRGSEVTVQIRDGALYLFYEGMSLRAGDEIMLTRSASPTWQQDGLRFSDGKSYYPGDLSLTIQGGMLQPVLTIFVEDYLLGVVPYEMSDSFPLEALKAQAVCARTYALAHIDTSRAYDVVDTTNDQVFRGVNPDHVNASRAVKETAGVVGTYQGKLATCYYSASNGGQTELVENVWSGRGDWSYYAMTDDPYDLENPESIVRRAVLSKTGSSLPSGLTEAVAAAMTQAMTSRGFDPSPESFRLDSLIGLSLGGARFAEPSRYVTELTLTFTWSGRQALGTTPTPTPSDEEWSLLPTPAPTPQSTVSSLLTATAALTPEPTVAYGAFTPVEGEFTVTLPLFPTLVRALKLSISGTDNEMITLTEREDAFVLEARRFGHGVGMSQRGAQWMAARYGKLFHEILSFYYPGMTLMRVTAGAPVLPTVAPDLADTPAPPATPTPRPTLMPVTGEIPTGGYLASVEGIEDDSSLNLRAEPNQASEILMRLYKHQQLIVLSLCDDPAWAHVKTDAAEGYVMVSFLQELK